MISVIAFDFANRREQSIPAAELQPALDRGLFCWVDMEADDPAACEQCLKDLGINDIARAEVTGPDVEGRYDVYEDCLHFALTEGRAENGRLVTSHVDIVLSARFMVTFHRRDAEFLKQMRRTCREDFQKFAKTPGFLLYEIGDHLSDRYRRTLQSFADSVEQTQLKLFSEVDDVIFKKVADLTADILVLRKAVMAARELFHELAARKSPFVPEATQPFLQNMAGAMERLGGDLTTEREVLHEMLQLYMGMVSHKTNKVVNRLTVISMIFLPLGFLCGVYGMNLKNIPETGWEYGYLFFWLLVVLLSCGLVLFMRRRKWL
jgi:magnesium transporter